MKHFWISALFCLQMILLISVSSSADQSTGYKGKPFLHPLFTDNMVLQRDSHCPVWGWAAPGTKVKVELNRKSGTAVADANGRWVVRLGKFSAGGPYTLKVTGPQTIELKNVMVGDVWLCSGQSNMVMGVTLAKDAKEEVAAAKYPNIRLFTVGQVLSGKPKEVLTGNWQPCTPETIASQGTWGGFSATAYYFGRDLQKELNVPIGLIQSAWNGTFAQAWIGQQGLSEITWYSPLVKRLQANVDASEKPGYDFNKTLAEWWDKSVPVSDKGVKWSDPTFDDSSWTTGKLPTIWQILNLPAVEGVSWFRRTFDVPAEWSSKETVVHLGLISDCDSVWINGRRIGSTWGFMTPREYRIPAGLLNPGKNVIAIGDLTDFSGGGYLSQPDDMFITDVDKSGKKVALAGDWKCKFYKSSDELGAVPEPLDVDANVPSVIYNGMIAPLGQFGVKGVIWYQGESNGAHTERYHTILTTLIRSWREQFQSGEFPFLIVQLANWTPTTSDVVDKWFPDIREAQLLTFKNVPNTGLASAVDIGDANDIHPKNKQEVGRRLALSALAVAYKQKVEHSGPIYKSMKIEGDKIRISFDHVAGGLVVKGGDKLKGFIIAGADKKFVWADAVIDGNTVVVSAAGIKNPKAVRYAWKMNPDCNLYNKVGLPASPFRTDVE